MLRCSHHCMDCCHDIIDPTAFLTRARCARPFRVSRSVMCMPCAMCRQSREVDLKNA
jgi:hypothetical protein